MAKLFPSDLTHSSTDELPGEERLSRWSPAHVSQYVSVVYLVRESAHRYFIVSAAVGQGGYVAISSSEAPHKTEKLRTHIPYPYVGCSV